MGVSNVNEAPTTMATTVMAVEENSAKGAHVGSITATDPEGDLLTFVLVGMGFI